MHRETIDFNVEINPDRIDVNRLNIISMSNICNNLLLRIGVLRRIDPDNKDLKKLEDDTVDLFRDLNAEKGIEYTFNKYKSCFEKYQQNKNKYEAHFSNKQADKNKHRQKKEKTDMLKNKGKGKEKESFWKEKLSDTSIFSKEKKKSKYPETTYPYPDDEFEMRSHIDELLKKIQLLQRNNPNNINLDDLEEKTNQLHQDLQMGKAIDETYKTFNDYLKNYNQLDKKFSKANEKEIKSSLFKPVSKARTSTEESNQDKSKHHYTSSSSADERNMVKGLNETKNRLNDCISILKNELVNLSFESKETTKFNIKLIKLSNDLEKLNIKKSNIEQAKLKLDQLLKRYGECAKAFLPIQEKDIQIKMQQMHAPIMYKKK